MILTYIIDIDETLKLTQGQGHKVKGQGHIGIYVKKIVWVIAHERVAGILRNFMWWSVILGASYFTALVCLYVCLSVCVCECPHQVFLPINHERMDGY